MKNIPSKTVVSTGLKLLFLKDTAGGKLILKSVCLLGFRKKGDSVEVPGNRYGGVPLSRVFVCFTRFKTRR